MEVSAYLPTALNSDHYTHPDVNLNRRGRARTCGGQRAKPSLSHSIARPWIPVPRELSHHYLTALLVRGYLYRDDDDSPKKIPISNAELVL